MLDLYKLQIFAAVVQEGSFSAAADRLYITQSAVSQHIKDLEAGLGRPLFERGWRGVTPTAHGDILYRYATDIFALVAKAETALTDIDQIASGRVSLGATPGIGIYLAPEWVQAFRARHPQITVALHTGVTSEIVGAVLRHKLDLGFIEGELDEHPPVRLAALALEEVEQQVIVGFKHPFWERDVLTLDDLRGQSMIVREASSQSRVWLDDTLRQHGITPVIGAEFDNLESIKRSVTIGLCLTVLPPYVVQAEVEQGLLRMIPISGGPLRRSLKVVWDAQAHFTPITRALLAEMSQQYPALASVVG